MPDLEIADHREEILTRWFDDIVDAYPVETAQFLRSRSDRFANPVGAILRENLPELLDAVLSGADPEDLRSALDRVIRVRAVQDISPSAAVGFVFDLKGILHEISDRTATAAMSVGELDRRIERLGLCAFDVYMRCREEMWAIRAREIRNQSVGIMERVAEWRESREEKKENLEQA